MTSEGKSALLCSASTVCELLPSRWLIHLFDLLMSTQWLRHKAVFPIMTSSSWWSNWTKKSRAVKRAKRKHMSDAYTMTISLAEYRLRHTKIRITRWVYSHFSLMIPSLASFLSIVQSARILMEYFLTVSRVLAPHPTWKWLLRITSCGMIKIHTWSVWRYVAKKFRSNDSSAAIHLPLDNPLSHLTAPRATSRLYR